MSQFGGIEGIDIGGWSVSDDQVMNLHGAEALGTWLAPFRPSPPLTGSQLHLGRPLSSCTPFSLQSTSRYDLDDLAPLSRADWAQSFNDMGGRAAGPTTASSVRLLRKTGRWDAIPYSRSGGGCGAAMRCVAGLSCSGVCVDVGVPRMHSCGRYLSPLCC